MENSDIEITIGIEKNEKTEEFENELAVNPQSELTIELTVEDAYRGETVNITVSLTNQDGTPVANETVIITVSGAPLDNPEQTNEFGKITIEYSLPDNHIRAL